MQCVLTMSVGQPLVGAYDYRVTVGHGHEFSTIAIYKQNIDQINVLLQLRIKIIFI